MSGNGKFHGEVIAKWLTQGPTQDDRDMELMEDFSFEDSQGKVWTAPVGSRINGASIPQILWSTVPPYVGKYRRASVVHDFHCVAKVETSEAVHRMFHDACLSDGLSVKLAGMMFAAVYGFGPKWDNSSEAGTIIPSMQSATTSSLSEREFEIVTEWITQNLPESPEEIEEYISKNF